MTTIQINVGANKPMTNELYEQKAKDIRGVLRTYRDLAESNDPDFANAVRTTLRELLTNRAVFLARKLGEFANDATAAGVDSYHVNTVYAGLGQWAYTDEAEDMSNIEPLLNLAYYVKKINDAIDAKAAEAVVLAGPPPTEDENHAS